MKKRILSLALVLLVMFSIFPAAAHAEQYSNLGTVYAGSRVYSYIADLPGNVDVSCDAVPAGCALETDLNSEPPKLYLGGSPAMAGSYSFTIVPDDPAGQNIICSLRVLPSVPVIDTSADVSCFMGDQALLSAAASVPDGGSLSYQWYSSPSGRAEDAVPIPEATGAEYMALTAVPGVMYYFCNVTNTLGGEQSSASSRFICVNVAETQIVSIMVNSMPVKTKYSVGDTLDTAGLTISVRLSNGTEQIIDSGFEVSPLRFDTPGQIAVLVSFGGRSCSFPVTVADNEAAVEGIGIVALPDRTLYHQGDILDTSGLIFRAYTADGYKDLTDGYTCSPTVLSGSGRQTITLSYMGKTCTFQVTVVSDTKLLEVSSTPAKLKYTVGESLDSSGLVLKVTQGSDVRIVNSGFSCEPTVFKSAGTQAVKVYYDNMVATFTVTVEAAAASPSPSPKASPSPSPSAPAASPELSPEPEAEHHKSGHGFLVAVLIIALLCLAGLGIAMLIMNAGGVEPFKEELRALMRRIRSFFRR
jgi:hypothetical protein